MPERRFQDIWKEQCEAAREVRQRHGVVSALDYLIGEKLLDYAEMAVTRPELAPELPSFVAMIRSMFGAEEIRAYLEHLDECGVGTTRPCRPSLLATTRSSRRPKSTRRRQNDFAG
jgi:hypothetical protein